MINPFFSDRIVVRVGKPMKVLLKAVLKQERKSNKKLTESDLVRIAVISYARKKLGDKADRILNKGEK